MKYYLLAFKNYFSFSGRSNRSEYWYFILFHIIFAIAALVLDFAISFNNGNPIAYVYIFYILVSFIPALAVTVRRLHDIDKSGWWMFVSFIPIVGSVWMIVLMASEGTIGHNKYGPDPNGNPTFDFESQAA
jgi:uncharacterized membrane protein YhaH (DUF805 family)